MKKEHLYYIIFAVTILHCIFVLYTGTMLITHKPEGYTASRPLVKLFGFMNIMVGISLGYTTFAFTKRDFQISFIIISASTVLLFLFGGWLPSLISAGLAGGLKFLATMD